jgi:hypothetical protein
LGLGERFRRQFLQIANERAGTVGQCWFENVAELYSAEKQVVFASVPECQTVASLGTKLNSSHSQKN